MSLSMKLLPLTVSVSVAASFMSSVAAGEASGLYPAGGPRVCRAAAKSRAAERVESEDRRLNSALFGDGAAASARSGQSLPVSVTASLGLGKMFGHTLYRIRLDEKFLTGVSGGSAESLLRFPLEVMVADLEVSVRSSLQSFTVWDVAVGLRKSVYDPVGIMEDSDWLSDPERDFHGKIAFTESDAEADVFVLDVGAGLELLRSRSVTVKWMVGYMYQDLSYEILGVSGWMLGEDYESTYFDLFRGVNVLDYQVSYRIPYLGIATSLWPSRGLLIGGRLTLSPIVSAYDRDDHILRRKSAEGGCRGTSFAGAVNATWIIASSERGPSWSLRLGGECLRTDTDGEQAQFFYGDDPGSLGDETGLRAEGVDLEISSRQYRVMLQLGASF